MLCFSHPPDQIFTALVTAALQRTARGGRAAFQGPSPVAWWRDAFPLTARVVRLGDGIRMAEALLPAQADPLGGYRLTEYHLALLYEALEGLCWGHTPGKTIELYHIGTLQFAPLARLFLGWPTSIQHLYPSLDPAGPPAATAEDLQLRTGPVPARLRPVVLTDPTLLRSVGFQYPIPGFHPAAASPEMLTVFDLRALAPEPVRARA